MGLLVEDFVLRVIGRSLFHLFLKGFLHGFFEQGIEVGSKVLAPGVPFNLRLDIFPVIRFEWVSQKSSAFACDRFGVRREDTVESVREFLFAQD